MKLSGLAVAGITLLFSLGTASAAVADPTPEAEQAQVLTSPDFQLPFPCGQTWTGNSTDSSAHQSDEIDFNRGSTADADLGDSVVAGASGTVVIAANQGSTNGFGNLVKIDHGGGYATYYAHLTSFSVSAGQTVTQGQKIGAVGKTTKPGINISAATAPSTCSATALTATTAS
ncbi:MAG TPA: M23 family metallopeptidase [Nonomuraea sp.]|nr:M23 family metallopeptidase [Nonomuraea sp.]